jgi:hypothetical protein
MAESSKTNENKSGLDISVLGSAEIGCAEYSASSVSLVLRKRE